MDRRRAIEEYYRCFRDRDLEALRSLLLPDFKHVSSFAVHIDRDRMLDEIWPHVGQSWARKLRIFGDGDEFMVKYEVESQERAAVSMAEYVRFAGDRMAEIQVFVGRQADE
jgi:hypothetical protein